MTTGSAATHRELALQAVQRGDCKTAEAIAYNSGVTELAHEIWATCENRTAANGVPAPDNQDAADDHQCRSYGAKRGSSAYVQCRLQLVQMRQQQTGQADQAARAAGAAAAQAAAERAAETARREAAEQAAANAREQADANRRALILQSLSGLANVGRATALPPGAYQLNPGTNCQTVYVGNYAQTQCH